MDKGRRIPHNWMSFALALLALVVLGGAYYLISRAHQNSGSERRIPDMTDKRVRQLDSVEPSQRQ